MADTPGPMGFNAMLTMVLLAGIALVAVGQALDDAGGYPDEADTARDLETTGALIGGFGTIVAATAVLLAGIRATGTHAALRGLLIVLAVLLLFSGLGVGFDVGGGFRG